MRNVPIVFLVLGGWSLERGTDPKLAKWFSVRVSPEECPWLFRADGTSQWASTSAELLASYMALFVFGWMSHRGSSFG